MEFGEYVNHRFTSEVLWDNQPKFYLNDEVRNKIQKVFDSVREIKFTTGTPFVGYKRYLIEINSIGLSPAYFDDEAYYIRNSVVPISATLNGENIDVIEAVDIYTEEFLQKKGLGNFLKDHVKLHNKFRTRAMDIYLVAREAETAVQKREIYFKAAEFVEDWLLSHILIEDKKYSEELKKFIETESLNENEKKLGVALVELFDNYERIFFGSDNNKFNKNINVYELIKKYYMKR